MSASMAEVLAAHWSASTHTDKEPFVDKCDGCGEVILTWGTNGDLPESIAAHQAEVLAANGYGKLGLESGPRNRTNILFEGQR